MCNKTKCEARAFADKLVDKFTKLAAQYPHLDSICIDLFDDFPSDEVMTETKKQLSARFSLDVREFDASPGRAGCVWMTPRKN